MTDRWTDGKGMTLINFLVNCLKGTVFLKFIDGSAHIHDAELIYKMLKEVIEEVREKNVIQWSSGSLLEVKSPPCKDLLKEFLGLLVRLLLVKGFEVPLTMQIHTKKMNCLEHDWMRDLAYIQYNKRLQKHYEECISGKEIDQIVLKSLDECAEWLVSDDARDDIMLGTDITYGMLEDAEDGLNDPR
ncbi:hypothetical protein GIB67_015686 [Kingdonia uniflora]|uniref:DUF659 domain-containing protein n=1 Tax=Kingdonia uniflora TaxID=39325 RepID=A0A7J7NUU6_9MAGN|nr:hypothetical protein GIB67_015686 [Kingdonia uniflora]